MVGKEIRNLLFLETHEPIDYREASRKYRDLLVKIHFDNSKDDYTARYTKALKRAEIKARAQTLLDQYESDSDPTTLRAAWALLDNNGYKKLEEYGFLSFYWKGEMIHQVQFERMLREAEQPADGKTPEAPKSPH